MKASYAEIITIEPGKRGGKPCIRGLRITVYDVLDYLAAGNETGQYLHGPFIFENSLIEVEGELTAAFGINLLKSPFIY